MFERHKVRLTRLTFSDDILRSIDLPADRLVVTRGLGSGLARRDIDGSLWAIGDRGPNMKVPFARRRYGIHHLGRFADDKTAKVMPCIDIGPAISEWRLQGDIVTCVRTLPLRGRSGKAISGLPIPGKASEQAIDLAGQPIHPDPSGADSEGIAAASDGTFWIADEYGPSLLHVAGDGTVMTRWVPRGTEGRFDGADYPVAGVLPASAARLQANRGFESVALSPDGKQLYLAFQSPLTRDDGHKLEHHVRLWTLDVATGALITDHLYAFDPPESFRRDLALGPVKAGDLKISELTTLAKGRLLVLERISATTKLYVINIDTVSDPKHPVDKTLLFSSDDWPELDPDLEGVVMLSPTTLVLVNDNDFGVDAVATRFWRLDFDLPFA